MSLISAGTISLDSTFKVDYGIGLPKVKESTLEGI
jgi:hypothetical protein